MLFQYLDCPVSTDDRYEIVDNRCLYFEDKGNYGFNLAQATCESAFVNGPGRVYEPTSVSNLQKVREIATRRSMNCFFLGIDDSLNEGTYLYTSDNSHVDLGVKSKIVVTNGCGPQQGNQVWQISAISCTKVLFASFLSGTFITARVVNPPERKLAKRNSVLWDLLSWYMLSGL